MPSKAIPKGAMELVDERSLRVVVEDRRELLRRSRLIFTLHCARMAAARLLVLRLLPLLGRDSVLVTSDKPR